MRSSVLSAFDHLSGAFINGVSILRGSKLVFWSQLAPSPDGKGAKKGRGGEGDGVLFVQPPPSLSSAGVS